MTTVSDSSRSLQESLGVDANVQLPPGYAFGDDEAIRRMKKTADGPEWVTVTSAPAAVVRHDIDPETGEYSLAVVTKGPAGRIVTVVAPRDHFLNARKLPGLAAKGMPVTSDNAREVARYLKRFEEHNKEALVVRSTTAKLGWTRCHNSFLFGSLQLAVVGHADELAFVPKAGMEDIASGFRTSGSLERWAAAARLVAANPVALVMLYGSVASALLPLLAPMLYPNFVIEIAAPTSTGKTAVLQLAGSVWGDPSGVCGQWKATATFIERTAAVLVGIPLILDDTKQHSSKQSVVRAIYDVSNGKAKGRGTVEGVQARPPIRTILLSSGEAATVDGTEDGGSRARTITLQGPPFGHPSEEGAQLIETLRAAIADNHGHLGPAVVEKLLRHAHDDGVRTAADLCLAHWRKRAAGNAVASRAAPYFAVLEVAGILTNCVADLGVDPHGVLEAVWQRSVAVDAPKAAPEVRALGYVRDQAASQGARFWGRHEVMESEHSSRPLVPHAGWLGAWRTGPSWRLIAFIPRQLEQLLRDGGFDPRAVVRAWKDKGWLLAEKGRTTARVTVHKDRHHCTCISREAFVAAGVEEPAQAGPVLAQGVALI
jgi:putative DNA primase/helicase